MWQVDCLLDIISPYWDQFLSAHPTLKDIWEGYYFGTRFGSQSLDSYIQGYLNSTTLYGKLANLTGAFFSSLWTPQSYRTTLLTLGTAAVGGRLQGRPFYRYVGDTSNKQVTWVTRGLGWKPPYPATEQGFQQAARELHLVDQLGNYRIPNRVIKVPYEMMKPIAGPRSVAGFKGTTGAVEYYYGKLTFPKPPG